MPSPQQVEDRKTQRRKLEDRLAADVIEECRTQLMLKFRFLDLALWRMELEPLRVGMRYPTATDGEKVYLDPPRVPPPKSSLLDFDGRSEPPAAKP